MKRIAALVATLALVVALGAAPVAGAATVDPVAPAQVESPTDEPSNETAEREAPGARLAGVVAVQGAEVEGEFEARAFGVRVAAANSNASRAAVVADQVATLQDRTEALRQHREALVEARENGSMSQARFRAEMAGLAARSGTLSQRVNQTESASSGLDPALLDERGVDANAIGALRTDARNLTGPDVAAIARSVAGPDVGGGLSVRETIGVDLPADGPGRDRRGGGPVDTPARTSDTADRGPGAPDDRSNRPTVDTEMNASDGVETIVGGADGNRSDASRPGGPPTG